LVRPFRLPIPTVTLRSQEGIHFGGIREAALSLSHEAHERLVLVDRLLDEDDHLGPGTNGQSGVVDLDDPFLLDRDVLSNSPGHIGASIDLSLIQEMSTSVTDLVRNRNYQLTKGREPRDSENERAFSWSLSLGFSRAIQ
jgi:hypothetical protein